MQAPLMASVSSRMLRPPSALLVQTHNINLNNVAKDAGKAARVDAKAARLLNNSGALALLLQVPGNA